MATIANLRVILTSRTAAFNRGMTRSARRIAAVGTAARSAGQRLRGLTRSFLGLALGGAGLGYLGKQGMDALDRLSKTAGKLGATTAGLGTLRVAARRSGVEATQFDTALQRLIRRLGTAAAGTEVMGKSARLYQRYFRAMGLSVDELIGLPADVAFRKWLKAMSEVDLQGKRLALTFKGVDAEGVGVLNMIDEVVHRWDEAVARAKDLGAALTETQLGYVVKMKDAMDDLLDKFRGIRNLVLIRIAPVLEQVFIRLSTMIGPADLAAEKMTGALQSIGKWFLRIADLALPALAAIGLAIGSTLELILRGGRAIARVFGSELPASLDSAIEELAALNQRTWAFLAGLRERGGMYSRVLGFFAEAAAKARTEVEAAFRTPFARMADLASEAGRARNAMLTQLAPTAFGAGRGTMPLRGWWAGTVQITTQEKQLKELERIADTVERIEREKTGLGE